MKLLVSPVSLEEARTAIDVGADIIDIKNPAEGSLGAQPPWVIDEIARYANSRGVPVSVTLGDLPSKPGTAALAAFGAAHLGVAYLKVGLYGTRTEREAVALLNAVRAAVRMKDGGVFIVAAGYGDYRRFGGLSPDDLVHAAASADCAFAMLDTSIKDGHSLFDVMHYLELETFVRAARRANLDVALAGSLGLRHLPALHALAPDIIGVRGALCSENDRQNGIEAARAREFINALRGIQAQAAATVPLAEVLGTRG